MFVSATIKRIAAGVLAIGLTGSLWAGYVPIVVSEDILSVVPYSDATIDLGANRRVVYQDAPVLLKPTVTHRDKIVKWEWYDGNRLVGRGSGFSTANLSVGTHTITLVATDDEGGGDTRQHRRNGRLRSG